jgi:hypothetical protein
MPMNDSVPASPANRIAQTWLDFWFAPVDAVPLAAVRIGAGLLGLMLTWSYGSDLVVWFGPAGMIPPDAVDGWRLRVGVSPLDAIGSAAGLQIFFAGLVAAFVAVAIGLASRIACVVAAILWAALLNRGPMIVGPADDCLAVLLWCLAVGPCGTAWSIDRLLRDRRGLPPLADSPWASTSLGLIRVHAAAITIGMILAQLKGDVWWNGTAAWWLAIARDAPTIDLTDLYRHSEYLMNAITHGIVAFEVVFATGLWFAASRQIVSRLGLVAWPLLGLLAGEPFFGLAVAIFCVPGVWSHRRLASLSKPAIAICQLRLPGKTCGSGTSPQCGMCFGSR